MRTIKQLSAWLACLLVFGCVFRSSIDQSLSEGRFPRQPAAEGTPEVTFGFDDSFRLHFGQRGVDIVNGAIPRDLDERLRLIQQQHRLQYAR
jgi:hypothetical protein